LRTFNILIISDLNYIKFAKALTKSISIFHPKIKIYLRLVNINKIQKKLIKNSFSRYNTDISFLEENLSNIKNKKSGNIEYSELMAFSANIRGKAIKNLLESGVKNLLYLDADSVLNKEIDFSSIKGDVGLFRRSNNKKKKEFPSGILYFSGSKKSIRFAKELDKNILKNGLLKWYSDQISLSQTYHKMHHNLNIYFFTEDYFDCGPNHSKESHIWFGKGIKKFKAEEYTKLLRSLYSLF